MKNITTIVVGSYQVNCYIIHENGHGIIIDPGTASSAIHHNIDELNLKIDAIYLTHGHFDHIGGVDEIAIRYNCPIYIHEKDLPLLTDPKLNVSYGNANIVVQSKVNTLHEGCHKIHDFEFQIINAPGHTEGSALFIWKDKIFCGDVIFKESIGRTDLPTGSSSKMEKTLQHIKQLNPQYLIFPGHGDMSTLEWEFQHNWYLK